LFTPAARLNAQAGQAADKFEMISRQLNLTPQQKLQLIPILKAEAPKVQAIRNDASLSRLQKIERLKAVHDETDPQVKSVLTSDQYQKLQEIRRTELGQAMRRKAEQ
jgi:hypothetical protein